MTASSKVVVFTIVFGVAYAVIYVICTEINLPLVTYHPVIGEVDVLWTPERRGPAMYWYGWMLTSLIGALALVSGAVGTAGDLFRLCRRGRLFDLLHGRTLHLRQGDC